MKEEMYWYIDISFTGTQEERDEASDELTKLHNLICGGRSISIEEDRVRFSLMFGTFAELVEALPKIQKYFSDVDYSENDVVYKITGYD